MSNNNLIIALAAVSAAGAMVNLAFLIYQKGKEKGATMAAQYLAERLEEIKKRVLSEQEDKDKDN